MMQVQDAVISKGTEVLKKINEGRKAENLPPVELVKYVLPILMSVRDEKRNIVEIALSQMIQITKPGTKEQEIDYVQGPQPPQDGRNVRNYPQQPSPQAPVKKLMKKK